MILLKTFKPEISYHGQLQETALRKHSGMPGSTSIFIEMLFRIKEY